MDKPLPQWILKKLASPRRRNEGCHAWIYHMACSLLPWRNPEETFRLIKDSLNDRRVPDREIREGIRGANKADLWQPGNRKRKPLNDELKYMKENFNFEQWLNKNCPSHITEEDLINVIPKESRFFESHLPVWKFVLNAIYQPHEILVIQKFNNDPPPQRAETITEWMKLARPPGQFICPNSLKSAKGIVKKRDDGQEYYSVRCLDNIQLRTFLIAELDHHDIPTQLRIHGFLSKQIPLVWLTSSAKRSIHGLYYWDSMVPEKIKELYAYFSLLGIDQACSDACRLTRLPGAIRHDKTQDGKIVKIGEQKLLYLDVNAACPWIGGNLALRKLVLERTPKK